MFIIMIIFNLWSRCTQLEMSAYLQFASIRTNAAISWLPPRCRCVYRWHLISVIYRNRVWLLCGDHWSCWLLKVSQNSTRVTKSQRINIIDGAMCHVTILTSNLHSPRNWLFSFPKTRYIKSLTTLNKHTRNQKSSLRLVNVCEEIT